MWANIHTAWILWEIGLSVLHPQSLSASLSKSSIANRNPNRLEKTHPRN